MELRRLLQAAPPTPPPGLGGGVVPGVPVGLARGVCRGECKGVPPEERGEPGGPGRGVERALGGGGCSPAPPPLGPREGSVCVLEVGEPPPRASSPVGSGEKENTGLCRAVKLSERVDYNSQDTLGAPQARVHTHTHSQGCTPKHDGTCSPIISPTRPPQPPLLSWGQGLFLSCSGTVNPAVTRTE